MIDNHFHHHNSQSSSALHYPLPLLHLHQIWGAEYQENNAFLVSPEHLPLVVAMGQRENCPVSPVGTVTGDGRVRWQLVGCTCVFCTFCAFNSPLPFSYFFLLTFPLSCFTNNCLITSFLHSDFPPVILMKKSSLFSFSASQQLSVFLLSQSVKGFISPTHSITVQIGCRSR